MHRACLFSLASLPGVVLSSISLLYIMWCVQLWLRPDTSGSGAFTSLLGSRSLMIIDNNTTDNKLMCLCVQRWRVGLTLCALACRLPVPVSARTAVCGWCVGARSCGCGAWGIVCSFSFFASLCVALRERAPGRSPVMRRLAMSWPTLRAGPSPCESVLLTGV